MTLEEAQREYKKLIRIVGKLEVKLYELNLRKVHLKEVIHVKRKQKLHN